MRVAPTADAFKSLTVLVTRRTFLGPLASSDDSRSLSPLFTWRGALVESALRPTCKHVGLTLSLHMNERGASCFPSVPTLCDETGLGETAVRGALNDLVKEGWLTRKIGGGRRSNEYGATIPTPSPAEGVPLASKQGSPSRAEGEDVIEDVAPFRTSSSKARARSRDEIYEALAVEFGAPATRNERSKRNGVVKQLKEAGATPAEIVDRRRRFEQRFPGATATDTTLMNHWGSLAPNGGRPVVPACPSCGTGQGLHAADCERLHLALVQPLAEGAA